MKKIVLITVLVILGGVSNAQVQTLLLGQREPTFYYWDTNWWDYYVLNVTDTVDFSSGLYPTNTNIGQPEYARYCWTDDSLQVIGVAAALVYRLESLSGYEYEDILPPVKDYLRLYEVDPATGELVLLASKSWEGFKPRYKIQKKYDPDNPHLISADPVYEVYFDSAFTVRDSFYVAATMFNNYRKSAIYGVNWRHYTVHVAYTYPWIDFIRQTPNHYRKRNHEVLPDDADTAWHVISEKQYYDENGQELKPPLNKSRFLAIFPIIDTSEHGYCASPSSLEVIYLDGNAAVLSWSGGASASEWDFSVCKDNCEPDSGTVIHCTSNSISLTGLDTAAWYTAYVRTVCSEYSKGQWSDSVRFYVPSNGSEGIEPAMTAADRYTYIVPNPASTVVTVSSSFRISTVDIFSLAGKLMASLRVDGITVPVDVSSFPAGTYIVRVSTNHGMATKKLIVE